MMSRNNNGIESKSESNHDGISKLTFVEYEIPVPWGVVTGKWWGCQRKQPILCLHGWQDNCGTFDHLIPLLPKERAYLAIDMPGHGKSSHLPKGMIYHFYEDGITLIRRIVKHYKWSNVTLMGHSLGGAISFMYASIYDNLNEVSKIIMIDTQGVAVFDQEKLASDAAHCIDKMLKFDNYPITMQPCHNYETTVGVVVDGHKGSITKKGAKALMIRGTMPAPEHLNKPDGLIFTRDLRLKVSSFGSFTEEQALLYARRIRCEVLNIRAKPIRTYGDPTIYPKVIKTLRENCKRLVYEEVEDVTHHLHLEAPSRICKCIQEFLLANPIDETQDDICVF